MWKKVNLIVVLVLIFLGLIACSRQNNEVTKEDKIYEIAILGKEAYVYSDEGFMNGVKMAVDELKQKNININIKEYDDNGSYEEGIVIGTNLSKKEEVLAVFTFQDFEVIQALAPIFDEAEKTLISVQGCYESTLNKGYKYFFSDFTSASDMGKAMANYAKKNKIKRVACSHTNTTFELDEIIGFQKRANELNNIEVIDMIQGPFNMSDLKNTYKLWESLGVEAVYLTHYTYMDTEWILNIIKYLNEQNSDLLIMGDYSLNNTQNLKKYGKYMEGVVIPAPYSVEESDLKKDFEERYYEIFKVNSSNVAVQGYDLINMIGSIIEKGFKTSEEFINNMKSEDGYFGVTGNIKFSNNGKLQGVDIKYLIVKDNKFIMINEEE